MTYGINIEQNDHVVKYDDLVLPGMVYRMDRRGRKKAATRQALLDSGLALFSSRGIYIPSIEEITDGADLGKGTFYQYFSSREDLIAATVARGFEALIARLDGSVPAGAGLRPSIRNLIGTHVAFFSEHPEYLLLFHQARGWLKLPGAGAVLVRREFLTYVHKLESLLQLGSDDRFKPGARRRLAMALAGSISGVLSFYTILGEEAVPSEGLFESLELLAAALSRRTQDSCD